MPCLKNAVLIIIAGLIYLLSADLQMLGAKETSSRIKGEPLNFHIIAFGVGTNTFAIFFG